MQLSLTKLSTNETVSIDVSSIITVYPVKGGSMVEHGNAGNFILVSQTYYDMLAQSNNIN